MGWPERLALIIGVLWMTAMMIWSTKTKEAIAAENSAAYNHGRAEVCAYVHTTYPQALCTPPLRWTGQP